MLTWSKVNHTTANLLAAASCSLMGVVLVAGGESQLSIWKKKAHKQEAEHRRIKQEDYKREWDRLVERRRTGNATMQNPFAKQRHRDGGV